jgi:hypothetical protein
MWSNGEYFALEGSHRLACAHYYGLVPKLNIIPQDSTDPTNEEYWDKLRQELPHYTWEIIEECPLDESKKESGKVGKN